MDKSENAASLALPFLCAYIAVGSVDLRSFGFGLNGLG
jgi:hypothetical protein